MIDIIVVYIDTSDNVIEKTVKVPDVANIRETLMSNPHFAKTILAYGSVKNPSSKEVKTP